MTYDQNQRIEIIAIALHYNNQAQAYEAGYDIETWEEACEHDRVQCRNEARDTRDPLTDMLQYSLNKVMDGNPAEHP